MGMTDDFETSLQVLRGFETDITVEVNEIKVILPLKMFSSKGTRRLVFNRLFIIISVNLQRSVASSTKRSSTVRFVDLKRRRYYFPLMVPTLNIFPLEYTLSTIRNIILKLHFCVCVCVSGWYRVACTSTTRWN